MTQRQYPFVPIGEFAKPVSRPEAVVPGRTYRQIGVHWWGKGVYEREATDGARTRYQTLYRVQTDDIVFNKIWARHGSAAIVPDSLDGCYGSGEFPTFEPNQDKLDPRWFHWIAQTKGFWERCADKSYGTSGKNRIQPQKILEIEIPLPPLPEQQRIVARIEALAGKIEAARGLRGEAMKETNLLLENSIDAVFQRVDYSSVPLRQLTTKIGSGSTPRGGESVYVEEGVPLIRSLNVRMRQFQWEGIAYIDDDTHQRMAATQVRRNDVLLNITGASIGRTSCAPDVPEANVTQHVMIVRPIEKLNSRYLMYWLSRSTMQRSIHDQQKGATRQAITKGQVEGFEIPLPPLNVQLRVVEELEDFQNRVETFQREQERTKLELDALLPAVLDRAFRGEL